MSIERWVIGSLTLLAIAIIMAIIMLARMPGPENATAAAALYGSLGAVISGLIAFVHSLPLPFHGNSPQNGSPKT